MDFISKTAIITGASVGIGRATAILMAKRGANLALADIDYEKLESVKNELAEFGNQVLIYKCDVSDESNVAELVNDVLSNFGKIDILVNNAALWRSSMPFHEVPSEECRKFFEINVFGVMNVTRSVLPGMLENEYGRIINVASIAGVYGNANMVNYSATKGAVIAMTKALAKETTKYGVTVNAVSPGSVSPSENPDIDYFQESALAFAGRTGTDRENAELICFLASDAAAYISGQNIQIDGCRKRM